MTNVWCIFSKMKSCGYSKYTFYEFSKIEYYHISYIAEKLYKNWYIQGINIDNVTFSTFK